MRKRKDLGRLFILVSTEIFSAKSLNLHEKRFTWIQTYLHVRQNGVLSIEKTP